MNAACKPSVPSQPCSQSLPSMGCREAKRTIFSTLNFSEIQAFNCSNNPRPGLAFDNLASWHACEAILALAGGRHAEPSRDSPGEGVPELQVALREAHSACHLTAAAAVPSAPQASPA